MDTHGFVTWPLTVNETLTRQAPVAARLNVEIIPAATVKTTTTTTAVCK